MGFVVLLLAGILSTMLFGPTPVLVVLGLGAAYAVLMLIAIEIGELGAAVRRIRFGRQTKTPSAASIADERAVRDAMVTAEWAAREPEAATVAAAKQAAWNASDAAREATPQTMNPRRFGR
jgi:hypothetical protein